MNPGTQKPRMMRGRNRFVLNRRLRTMSLAAVGAREMKGMVARGGCDDGGHGGGEVGV